MIMAGKQLALNQKCANAASIKIATLAMLVAEYANITSLPVYAPYLYTSANNASIKLLS